MRLTSFLGQKKAGTFNHDVNLGFVPFQFSRIFDCSQTDFFAIDDQRIAVDSNVALETAMHGIMLEHVSQVVWFQQIIDGDDFYFRKILCGSAEHHTPDTAESIDPYANRHFYFLSKIIKNRL